MSPKKATTSPKTVVEVPPQESGFVQRTAGNIDLTVAASSPTPSNTSADTEHIIRKMEEMGKTITSIITQKVDDIKESIEGKIDALRADADAQIKRTEALEKVMEAHENNFARIYNEVEVNNVNLTAEMKGNYKEIKTELSEITLELKRINEEQKAKIFEMEYQKRKLNIRIVGLDESVRCANPEEFATELQKILGTEILPNVPEVEQCYRLGTRSIGNNAKPRVILVILRQVRIKEMIIRETRRMKGNLKYMEVPIHCFEDYCRDVVELRAKFKTVMSQLYLEKYRPLLIYPAILRIVDKQGARVLLNSPEDAAKFLSAQHAE